MTVDEQARHELQTRLEEVIGAHPTATLMSYLPPVGWADVATKRDLDQLADRTEATLHRELRGLETRIHEEIGGLRSEVHQEIGGLRIDLHEEIGGLRSEVHEEIGGLRTDLHEDVGGLRSEVHQEIGGLRTELHEEIGTVHRRLDDIGAELREQTRTLLLGTAGLLLTLTALVVGALQLL